LEQIVDEEERSLGFGEVLMARPLRPDESRLTHHITNRGNERKKIFRDDAGCTKFLELLAETVRRFCWDLRGRQARIATESEHHPKNSDGHLGRSYVRRSLRTF
jgi:hypothetical protein